MKIIEQTLEESDAYSQSKGILWDLNPSIKWDQVIIYKNCSITKDK
ncbi:MAG TPA: hypothetical protein VIY98_12215 [Nitrososphaeraceae archaeon]